jgi:hypothetical protein
LVALRAVCALAKISVLGANPRTNKTAFLKDKQRDSIRLPNVSYAGERLQFFLDLQILYNVFQFVAQNSP